MEKELLDIIDIFNRNRAALAPLAGVTDSVFRRICAGFGARPVMIGMISSDGYVRGKPGSKTERLLRFCESERPIGFQFFGSDPDIMAEAAYKARDLKPDFIDINAGCPMKKIVTKGSGAALLKNPELLGRIVERVVHRSTVPVTVKIRSGWDFSSINAVDVARICVDAGVSALIVHPRTRSQGFGGLADHTVIRAVREAVDVPVIGSGDIAAPDDAVSMLEETGADAVMIGRRAKGNPWIFKPIMERLRGDEVSKTPPTGERMDLVLRHIDMLSEEVSERFAVLNMRKFIGWYSKGASGGKSFCQRVFRAETVEEMKRIIRDFQINVQKYKREDITNSEMVEL